jgi:hypothetical protein
VPPENLYTVVLEYRGGTYISQVLGPSLSAALKQWANALNENDLANWGLSRPELTEVIEDDPALLDGCINAWCLTGLSGSEELILLNVVATIGARN